MDRPSPLDTLRSNVRIASWFSVVAAASAALYPFLTWWSERAGQPNLLVVALIVPATVCYSYFAPPLLATALGCWVATVVSWRRVLA
ncbi:hypothetical protein ATJ88_3279 [Isoptericola jiangsuensis]|uniref:Uncharacterized protein n=1 Tax=Isoptericola jiangsuensis TaxID=548579 RepID=A0A2A9F1Y9_9MICO|nr:hypothetical protein [Isoptericola jiangsuensis]PFG44552.1 hypothetical protein ATJ88_3279 [Isoptericola jiangsuensis]